MDHELGRLRSYSDPIPNASRLEKCKACGNLLSAQNIDDYIGEDEFSYDTSEKEYFKWFYIFCFVVAVVIFFVLFIAWIIYAESHPRSPRTVILQATCMQMKNNGEANITFENGGVATRHIERMMFDMNATVLTTASECPRKDCSSWQSPTYSIDEFGVLVIAACCPSSFLIGNYSCPGGMLEFVFERPHTDYDLLHSSKLNLEEIHSLPYEVRSVEVH